jgi:hypothetical protein
LIVNRRFVRFNTPEFSEVMNASAGSIFLGVALTLSFPFTSTAQVLFSDSFDSYASPSTITASGAANGYNIYFSAPTGPEDFTAVFGFDYSGVSSPVTIPPAPHSTGGTTKGLYLTVNKDDSTAAISAVNLYPLGQNFSGNYSLTFDLWMQPGVFATTEHALFGINHSGLVTNQIIKPGSDGLFYAMDGDGGVANNNPNIRDFSVYQGTGPGTPQLVLSNFGPVPALGTQFDNAEPGFTNLFPVTPANGANPAGSPCYRWVAGEVRQEGSLITWLLDGVIVAQYTNATAYTSGNIMLGYADTLSSVGIGSFAIFDNINVSAIPEPSAVTLVLLGNGLTLFFVGGRRRRGGLGT